MYLNYRYVHSASICMWLLTIYDCVSPSILSDALAARTADNVTTKDEDDDDNLSTNSNPPAPAFLPTTTLRRKS